MASWVLTAMDLACQKAQRTLFESVSFSVSAGSWLHIEGGNGCGKTSLLRILCGLSPAARGQVLWPSSPGNRLSRPDRSVLHYIGHALGLKPDLTACENLCVDAQVSGLALSRQQALQALAAQGLRHHLTLFEATCLAVQAHALAADRLVAQGVGPVGLTPMEVAVEIRRVING